LAGRREHADALERGAARDLPVQPIVDLADLDQFPDDSAFRESFGVGPDHPDAVPAPRRLRRGTAALTGLGSRFDGYLSALLPGFWDAWRVDPPDAAAR